MYLVYMLTCLVTGKSYIGITSRSAEIRWAEHLARVRQGLRNSRLYAAIRKHGADRFVMRVLERTEDPDRVRELERHYIAEFDTYRSGYNSNLGGHGLLEVSDEIRRKIAAPQRGKIIPPETRERMSKAKRGDSRCAVNFGAHVNKGAQNPRAGSYRVRYPDGTEHLVTGMRAFLRDHGLSSHLRCRGREKGYVLLGRLND